MFGHSWSIVRLFGHLILQNAYANDKWSVTDNACKSARQNWYNQNDFVITKS